MPETSAQKVQWSVAADVRVFSDTEAKVVYSALQQQIEAVTASHDFLKAKTEPVVDGKPRMLHVTAWLAHEGMNNNRDVLFAEDLEALVSEKKLFQAPFGGVIDYNHELQPIGYWYDAEYGFNEKVGKHGILAHGAVWAWLFPTLTDKMVAEYTRHGKIDTSITALSKNTSISWGDDGQFVREVRSPVIVASSFLDIDPADPAAVGNVTEDNEQTPELRREALIASMQRTKTKESNMPVAEIKQSLNAALDGLDENIVTKVVERVEAAFETKAEELRNLLAQNETEIDALTARATEAETKVAELETAISERDLVLADLKDENTAATGKITELEGELETLRAAEAERALETLRTERVADLPETVKARLEAMPTDRRDALELTWASLSDEEWAARKEELGLGVTVPTGRRLPSPGVPGDSGNSGDLSKFLR